MEKLNIYQRMNNIMNECQKVEKNGFNKFGGYKYVMAVDVIGNIQKLLVSNGVHLTINETSCERREYMNAKGVTNYFSKLGATATFVNIDKPDDKIEVTYFSISADSGDKDIFKAKTNGLKYVLSQQFMIVSSDFIDTENDSNETSLDVNTSNFKGAKERKEKAAGKNVSDTRIPFGKNKNMSFKEVGPDIVKGMRDWCASKNDDGKFNEIIEKADLFLSEGSMLKAEGF